MHVSAKLLDCQRKPIVFVPSNSVQIVQFIALNTTIFFFLRSSKSSVLIFDPIDIWICNILNLVDGGEGEAVWESSAA